MTFRDGHQSGFHAVSRPQQRAMNQQMSARTSVCGLTEQAGFAFLGSGWDKHGLESKVAWDTDRWKLQQAGVKVIHTSPWVRGTSHRTHVQVPWVFLERAVPEEKSFTLFRAVFHFPAHRSDSDQAKAGDEALDQIAEEFESDLRRLKPTVTTFSGDTNEDFRRKQVVAKWNRAFEPLGCTVHVPPSATIRGIFRRRIDVVISDAQKVEITMLPWLKGYDHRGFQALTTP